VYTLTIGYHELQGSKVSLKKPLVVLKKIKLNCGKVELHVVGIVRHKILFKTRPKAIISSKILLLSYHHSLLIRLIIFFIFA
jgi:chromosome transmission fidelity protein 8